MNIVVRMMDGSRVLCRMAGISKAVDIHEPPKPAAIVQPAPQAKAPSIKAGARAYANPAAAHLATGPNATPYHTHAEMSLPSTKTTRQPHSDLDTIYHHAAAHKEHMDNIIDRGKGLSAKLNMHVVENRPLTHNDFAEARRKNGLVHIAPLKGRDRAQQKIDEDYGGDPSKIRDLSRATIAVHHKDDIAHVTHHLRRAGMKLAAAPKDNFSKPTPLGYQDLQTAPVHPASGHVGELQLNTLDHLQAKSLGLGRMKAGHERYEVTRNIETIPEKVRTVQQRQQFRHHLERSKVLYTRASELADSRTPRLAKGPNDVTKAYVHGHYRRDHGHGGKLTPQHDQRHKGHTMAEDKPNSLGFTAKTSPARAQYLDYDGQLARIPKFAHHPELWDGKQWKPVRHACEFMHNVSCATHAEAIKLAKANGYKGALPDLEK